MALPKALVLRAPGTNCDEETIRAWELAGASAELATVAQLLAAPGLLDAFEVVTVPGGFSFGDDLGAGRIFAQALRGGALDDALQRFRDRGGFILGICNGFQVLVRAGLLPGGDRPATLAANDSGHYENRWTRLTPRPGPGPWLDALGGRAIELPSAHGEGKFLMRLGTDVDALMDAGQVALCYADQDGQPTERYPLNPSGSPRGIAAVRDATGQVFGLMPHPERYVERLQHPRWTRDEAEREPDGLLIFRGAVDALK